jgi:nucleolar protein 14
MRLILGQCLTQCPVESPVDICSGLFVATLLLDLTAESGRHVPEVVTFLRSLVCSTSVRPNKLQGTFDIEVLSSLRATAATLDTLSVPKIPFKYFRAATDKTSFDTELSSAVMHVLLTLTSILVKKYENTIAFHEIISPLIEDLRNVRPQDEPSLPIDFQTRYADGLLDALRCLKTGSSGRRGLAWRPLVKASISTMAPKFETNYSLKKDQDEDRDRAKLKQLGRQLKRETKSTLREIRRDADFIDQERYAADSARKERLRDERGHNFAWMESEQASLKQQVRMGKGLMKGGGSGVTKKARVSR